MTQNAVWGWLNGPFDQEKVFQVTWPVKKYIDPTAEIFLVYIFSFFIFALGWIWQLASNNSCGRKFSFFHESSHKSSYKSAHFSVHSGISFQHKFCHLPWPWFGKVAIPDLNLHFLLFLRHFRAPSAPCSPMVPTLAAATPLSCVSPWAATDPPPPGLGGSVPSLLLCAERSALPAQVCRQPSGEEITCSQIFSFVNIAALCSLPFSWRSEAGFGLGASGGGRLAKWMWVKSVNGKIMERYVIYSIPQKPPDRFWVPLCIEDKAI